MKLLEFIQLFHKDFKPLPYQKELLGAMGNGERLVIPKWRIEYQSGKQEDYACSIAMELLFNPHHRVKMDADMGRRVKKHLHYFREYTTRMGE